MGYKYNNKTYIYVKNLQGDVTSVIDGSTGLSVANYIYDSWGNVLTATGTMAEMNPIRYRGYYYDTEISLYYLQSRYYDAKVGRFINADNIIRASISGSNMYRYCTNDPVLKADQSGHIEHFSIYSLNATRASRTENNISDADAFFEAFQTNYGFDFYDCPPTDNSPQMKSTIVNVTVEKVTYVETRGDRIYDTFISPEKLVSVILDALSFSGVTLFSWILDAVTADGGGPSNATREAYVVTFREELRLVQTSGNVTATISIDKEYRALYIIGAGTAAYGQPYFEHDYKRYWDKISEVWGMGKW